MEKKISRVVVILWMAIVVIIGIKSAYNDYQLYKLEKVEHEVDLMYDIVR